MQHHASLASFQAMHNVLLPGWRAWPWRLTTKAPVGEVHGIPTMRGKAVATNGILVAIETSSGKLMFGHLDNFVCDDKDEIQDVQATARPAKARKFTTEEINILLE